MKLLNVDEVVEKYGFPTIEDVPFDHVSFVNILGQTIICLYYQLDSEYSIVAYPFIVHRDNRGVISKIERYNLLSLEIFSVIRNSSIVVAGPLDNDQIATFTVLCESWNKLLESKIAEMGGQEIDGVDQEDITENIQTKTVLH